MLEDDKGKRMGAMKVFSSAIGYLKDHMMKTCRSQLTDIEESDIRWVLTVPAIWHDSAKQFMRRAAEKVWILLKLRDLNPKSLYWYSLFKECTCRSVGMLLQRITQERVAIATSKLVGTCMYFVMNRSPLLIVGQ